MKMKKEFAHSKAASWGLIAFTVLIVLMLSAIFSALRAQDFSRADSALLITATDSTFRVYTQYANDADQSAGYTTEQLDSVQTANLLFNMLYDAQLRVYVQSAQLLFSAPQVTALKQDIDAALTALSGVNYLQMSEARYITQLAPLQSNGQNEAFYSFKQGATTKIVRIRGNGAVREVNSSGATVAGGLQGNVKIWAGLQRIEVTFNAGPLTGQSFDFYQLPAKNNRPRWATTDKGTFLIRRNAVGYVGANALGK